MDFILKRSNRRTVALEIAPDGSLIVRAPLRYTQEQAEAFVSAHGDWVKKHLPDVLNKRSAVESLSAKDIAVAKKAIKLLCEAYIRKYAPIMQVEPQRVTVTSAKKRFGSCSGKNTVCFSYLLILYPLTAIEYVVVHELAHILHHDHSAAFHRCVEKYLPSARIYEKQLCHSNASYTNFQRNVESARNLTC